MTTLKRMLLVFMLLSAVCFNGFVISEVKAETQDLQLYGGYDTYTFTNTEELRDFSLFSAYKENMYILDGVLWSQRSEEKKAILDHDFTDDFNISVDLVTPVENAYLDGGIYLGVNGSVYDGTDMINAYEVHVRRENTNNVIAEGIVAYKVLIYKFNYEWLGAVASTTVYANSDVRLNVLVRGATINVTVNESDDIVLKYVMSDYVGGKVGLRVNNCQMGFDNLLIKSEDYVLDYTKLNSSITNAKNIVLTEYIQESIDNYQTILAQAEELNQNATDQNDIDKMAEQLDRALNLMIKKYSYQDLQAFISQANELIASGNHYTPTSLSCLQHHYENALNVNSSATEKEISLCAHGLMEAINALVAMYE